jgi:plastocyanin
MANAFNLTAQGHPFLIQTGAGVNYNTGLIHVSTAGVVSTGSFAQGKDSGTLYWKIPANISGTYRYQCSVHPLMQGNIVIKDISTI